MSNPISAEFARRADLLHRIRKKPEVLAALRVHYAECPADFIGDWGMTYDPRAIERGDIASMPFNPWPKQREYLEWVSRMWRAGERGLVEKSRDCGVTWLSVGWAVTQWLFRREFAIGFGSRKEELVDAIGDPKSIFDKARSFIRYLPPEFLPAGFDFRKHASHMRLLNPENGSTIIGEAGDNIGRGGRTSIYFLDEAAFIEHQDAVEAALSQNTNAQIDISTPNGNGNAFYRKRMRLEGRPQLFVFDWRDDPRKTQDWYDRQKELFPPYVVAQEVDRDYNASAEDAFIPAAWVKSAIDAHLRLGFIGSGIRVTGFDPADVGSDPKAIILRHGSIVMDAAQLKEGGIDTAIQWAFALTDRHRSDALVYDGDGMGAPAMRVALTQMSPKAKVLAYRGGGAVIDDRPHRTGVNRPELDKTPGEMFLNYRAQTWTWVRERFERTHEAMTRSRAGQLVNVDPADLISISSKCTHLHDLVAELSRPMRVFNANGKIRVEAKADMKRRGVSSPNLADALVMAFSARAAAVTKPSRPKPIEAPMYDSGAGY